MGINYNELSFEEKTIFLKNAEADKLSLLSMPNTYICVFQRGILWDRIDLELSILSILNKIPEVEELAKIDCKATKDEYGCPYRGIKDMFDSDYLTDELATIALNKYSSVGEAMRNTLPKFDHFKMIEKNMNYLWSVPESDKKDLDDLSMARCFRGLMENCCYRLIGIKDYLCNMSETPCYIYVEKNRSFVSAKSKVLTCLQRLLHAFGLLKPLHLEAQQMKKLSIFVELENIYPTVDCDEKENALLRYSGFCIGGHFTYVEYLNRLIDVYREVLDFWKGLSPDDEELKKREDHIRTLLEKSEKYFQTEGKPFQGIVTEPIAYSYSLATVSAFRAYADSSAFFKDMLMIVQIRANYMLDCEPYHIDESLLKFAAEARLLCSTGYEIEDMFGQPKAPSESESD